MVYAGPIFYPADAARDLLRAFRDWAAGAPDEITALVNLTTAPPLPVIPEEWHGKKVAAFIAASAGPIDEGEALVARLPHGRPSRSPTCSGRCRTTVIQTLIDPLWPKGIHAYFKATNLARLDDELIDRLCELHLAAPGPQCEIHVHQMGGAVARVAEGATAFAERSMPFLLNAVTGWHDPAEAEAHIEWARAVIDAARGRVDRPRVRQLPRRRRRGALVVRRRDVRPARRAEERVRPDERVPAEPEHRPAGSGCAMAPGRAETCPGRRRPGRLRRLTRSQSQSRAVMSASRLSCSSRQAGQPSRWARRARDRRIGVGACGLELDVAIELVEAGVAADLRAGRAEQRAEHVLHDRDPPSSAPPRWPSTAEPALVEVPRSLRRASCRVL